MCMNMCLHVSTCVYMCPHVIICVLILVWYQHSFLLLAIHVLCWSFVHVWLYKIVGTQYGFSPLCVANLLFVLGLFADTAFAFGVMCLLIL